MLVAEIGRNLPGAGTGIEIAHTAWTRRCGRPDRARHAADRRDWSAGLWLASGFGGRGLNTSALGRRDWSRGASSTPIQTWRLFCVRPNRAWAGGRLGRALAQGIYWGTRPVERIEQGLARYRERARLRKQTRLAALGGHGPPPAPEATSAAPD